jgi:hypothetical protein
VARGDDGGAVRGLIRLNVSVHYVWGEGVDTRSTRITRMHDDSNCGNGALEK